MMNYGFIGIGQAGCNIADTFATEFPAIAINTAQNDLAVLSNIKTNNRIHTDISEGGAGKSIRYGEKAIRYFKEGITDAINLNKDLRDSETIWLIAGLGGGTGSLGIVQMSVLLSRLGRKHSMIVTVPANDEGTTEKANALVSGMQIYNLLLKSKNLRSVIIMDNELLKKMVLDAQNRTYEKLLNEENAIIFKSFKSFYELSKLNGATAFDTEDYKGLADEQGCLVFAEATVQFNEGESLAAAVINSWRNTVYLSGDVTKATAMAAVVQRPTGFDKGGKEINDLFESLKGYIPSGKFCRGVYYNDNLIEKAAGAIGTGKPIRISSMLTGLPFPMEYFIKLQEQVDKEMADVEQKRKRSEIDLDLKPYINFIDRENHSDVIEELDFTIFKETK